VLKPDAATIRLRAEQRCGELLVEMEKAKGAKSTRGVKGFQRRSNERTAANPAPTLAEVGIS